MARITGIAPFLLVADVRRAAEYYREKLGFHIVAYFFEEPPVFAVVRRDEQIVMLRLRQRGQSASNRHDADEALDAYLWTDDVDALHAEFRQSGADIVSAPQLRSYGLKELEVRDLDGYILCFGQDTTAAKTG